MLRLLRKIASTKRMVMDRSLFTEGDQLITYDPLPEGLVTAFADSLSIREVAAGSSNAEEQELTALTNTYYDIERFGLRFVASPRHADVLMVAGPVSRNMAHALKQTYNAMPDPKIVIAVGDGAIDGGVFRGSYAIYDSVRDVIPMHFGIPGDPPSPKRIASCLLRVMEIIQAEAKRAH